MDSPDLLPVGFQITVFQGYDDRYFVTTYVGDDIQTPETSYAYNEAEQFFEIVGIATIKFPERYVIEPNFTAMRRVLILGGFKDYHQAVKQAEKISQKTKIQYSDRGMEFDKNKGLIFKEKENREPWEGYYFGRRVNQCDTTKESKKCISVEKSDFYSGFSKGYYIVVGGVLEPDVDYQELLGQYKMVVPDVYVKNTILYMGCIH